MSTRFRFPQITALRAAALAVCLAIFVLIVYGFGDGLGAGLGAGFIVFSSMELARRWRRQDETNRSATNGSDSEQ